MHYLVVVGDEEEHHQAASAALRHVHAKDTVLLATVVEAVVPDPNAVDTQFIEGRQRSVDEEARQKMRITGNQFVCKDVGCEMVVLSGHPGRAICKIAVDKSIDVIIIGDSKEPGMFQKMFGVSSAKYCVDNAQCNVVVVKRPYPHVAPTPAPAPAITTTATTTAATFPTAPLTHTPAPAVLTTSAILSSRLQATGRPASPKIGQLPRLDDRTGWTKLEHELYDQRQRIEAQYRALSERLQQMEEDEISRQNKERQAKYAAEMAKLRGESEPERELVRSLEEAERQRRLEEEIDASQEHRERMTNIQLADQLAEEEKTRRIALWKEQVASLEQRHEMIEYTRALEEQERQDRVNRWNAEIEVEESMQKEASHNHLAELARLEEEERARRVQIHDEEEKAVRLNRAKESQEDLNLVRSLEEEERQRRLAEEKERAARQ